MPWITNVSYIDIKNGTHPYDSNTILIQIVDPNMEFPKPTVPFVNVFQFEFLDTDLSGTDMDEFVMSDNQADSIAQILVNAYSLNQNVLVHCVAGLCRSGAVTEVGTIIGFEDKFNFTRLPNVTVKCKLIQSLNLYGD